jgi:hypothetical protein
MTVKRFLKTLVLVGWICFFAGCLIETPLFVKVLFLAIARAAA